MISLYFTYLRYNFLKIEEHEKALKIFVYTLKDYAGAANYCLINSKDSMKQRKNLFNILFSIYMNPSVNK